MYEWGKKLTVFVLIVGLLLTPLAGVAAAEEAYEERDISTGEMIADLAIVRPVGIASMITGSILFLFTLPFSFSEENMDQNREEIGKNITKLIVEPSKHTFNRRLGDM